MTQIPIYNVNNNAATGATGLHLARSLIGNNNGAADCILVIGFEKMYPGGLQSFWHDRENPGQGLWEMMVREKGVDDDHRAPGPVQMFGNAGREYMQKCVFES